MKNRGLLRVRKYYKMKRMSYYNFKKLYSFRNFGFFSGLG